MLPKEGSAELTLGRKCRVAPVFASESICGKYMTGELVYIHPDGRYGVIEFEGVNGKCRESFWPEELKG